MPSLRPKRSSLLLLALVAAFSLLHPPAPIQAQEGESLLLVWAANEEQDLRGYRIYESDASGNLGTRVYELLVEDIPWDDRIRGIVTFEVADVLPGEHCWAVTAFDYPGNESLPSAAACASLGEQESAIHMADFHEDSFYGSYPGEGGSYDEGVVYTFDGKPGEQLLVCRLWDINTPTEVEILLNGVSLGYADMTGSYAASPLLTTWIPPEYLNEFGLNTLTFEWTPAGEYDMWAVGAVEILDLIPLPAPDFYGNLVNVPSGDTSHPRSVGFMFEGRPGAALMRYQVYDVDFVGEIEIFLNGEPLGRVVSVRNNAYLDPFPVYIPDHKILNQGVNTIVFTNILNPPYSLIWGVGDVKVPYY